MKTTKQLYKAFYSANRSGGMYEGYKAFQGAIDDRGLAYAIALSLKAERIHCRRNREIYPYCDLDIRLTAYKYSKRKKTEQTIQMDNGFSLCVA